MFKEAQRLQGVQRGSNTFTGVQRWRESFKVRTTIRMERSRGGVAEMQHPFFVALQCVSDRHSKTQHLVAKKTNNFNDLTVKNRLTAVVMPLHVVA